MALPFENSLQAKILKSLITSSLKEQTVRGLARLIEVDAGNLSRQIKQLEELNLIKSELRKRSKYFSINQQHPLYEEMRNLYCKEEHQQRLVVYKLPLGLSQHITADYIQAITSEWTAVQFTRLCNSLIFAMTESRLSKLPDVTERVNVADGGRDAILSIEPSDLGIENSFKDMYLLRNGLNVYQYKLRSLLGIKKNDIVSALKTKLTKEISQMDKKANIANYVLFVNFDLDIQKKPLEEFIAKKFDNKIQVEVIDAAKLAMLCNNLPYIRSAFFSANNCLAWDEALERHMCSKSFPRTSSSFIGRTELVRSVVQKLRDDLIKVIVITGSCDLGKSRLALEVTKDYKYETVVFENLQAINLPDLSQLSSKRTVILVLDNPGIEANRIIDQVLGIKNLKVILTLPYADYVISPSRSVDSSIVHYILPPLTSEESEQLLTVTGKVMDYGLSSWIISHSGGNPGVILSAAKFSENLRKDVDNFSAQIGSSYVNYVLQRYGEKSLEALKVISVLSQVGVSGKSSNELQIICQLLFKEINPHKVLEQLRVLEKVGLVIFRGSFVEIAQPILASYLCSQLIKGREMQILVAFISLPESAQFRLLSRLIMMKVEDVTPFWDQVFAVDGAFASISSTLKNLKILKRIAKAVPEKVLSILQRHFGGLSINEVSEIVGDNRRDLIWTLDDLLLRASTSFGALRLLALFAEAENEKISNNAEGTFCESFFPLHRQIPLRLDDRLSVLKECSTSDASIKRKLLAIHACKSVVKGSGCYSLRSSDTFKPLDGMPDMTWKEIYDYMKNSIEILFTLSNDPNPEVSKHAFDVLPGAVTEYTQQGRILDGLDLMQKLAQTALNSPQLLGVDDVAESVNYILANLRNELKKGRKPETQQKIEEGIRIAEGIKQSLTGGSFAVKVRRWAGRWTFEGDDDKDQQKTYYQFQAELQRLADEAIANPALLKGELLQWLSSSEAQRSHAFFHYLGEKDEGRALLEALLPLGKSEPQCRALANYCAGQLQHSSQWVKEFVKDVYEASSVCPHGIVLLVSTIHSFEEGVNYVAELLNRELVSSAFVEGMLVCGRWFEHLSEEQFLKLLKAIAKSDLSETALVMDMLGMRLHLGHKLTGKVAEFAWQCLEVSKTTQRGDTWDFDQVAAHLFPQDYERALKITSQLLLEKSEDKCWNPLDRYAEQKAWNVLMQANPARTLEGVINVGLKDPTARFRLTWNLGRIIDQEANKDILIGIGKKSVEHAKLVGDIITTERPGFWPIAIDLVETYPAENKIKGNLIKGIEQMGNVISGNYSKHLEECKNEVEAAIGKYSMQPAVKTWLISLKEQLANETRKELIRELDEDVDDFRSSLYGQDSLSKDWAIERLLQNIEIDEVVNLVKPDVILASLDRLSLSEDKKREIRGFIQTR